MEPEGAIRGNMAESRTDIKQGRQKEREREEAGL